MKPTKAQIAAAEWVALRAADMLTALATAVEAGERDENWDAYAAGLKDGKTATIERCAQKIEEMDRERGHRLNSDYAAAIRAMKP